MHDGLQHHRPRLAQRRQRGLARGGHEGDLLAVDAVVFAVVHRHLDVHHRVAADGAQGQRLAHALLHCGHEVVGNGAALHRVDELETRGCCQGLDTQEDLAELTGATRLFLVAVVALGVGGDGLEVGDARRRGLDLELVGLAHAVQQHAQVQLAQAVEHGLVAAGQMLDLQARVFVDQLGQDLPQPLLVAVALRLDGQAVHGLGQVQRREVDVVVFGRVVQHGVVMQRVDLGHGHDVAWHGLIHLHRLLALQHEQVRHLEGLAAVADEECSVARQRALVHAEDPQAADEGVDRDLEDMGQHVQGRVRHRVHRLGGLALAAQKVGRVGLQRVGQQFDDHVQQLGHADAALARDEDDGDQVAFAQRLFQRRVQLGGVDIAVVEVAVDKSGIHFNHLLDECPVCFLDAAEVGLHTGRRVAVEKTIDHPRATGGRQVQRQAFLAEGFAHGLEHGGEVDAGAVDLVDDDQAVQVSCCGVGHHAARHRLDADGGVDDHGGGLHRLQRRQAVAEEVGAAGGIQQMHADAAVVEVQHRGVQRMLHAAFECIEVADRAAALDAARCVDGSGAGQQGLGQGGLACRRRAHQGQRTDGGRPEWAAGEGCGHGRSP